MIVKQSFEIEIPRMNMWRIATSPLKPGHVAAQRVQGSLGVGKEGRKQESGGCEPDRDGCEDMREAQPSCSHWNSACVQQTIPNLIAAQSEQSNDHVNEEGLFGRV